MSRLWPEHLTLMVDERGGLEQLRARVATLRGRVDVTVVLSNHLVRYAVLPPQNGPATPDEETALARFQFTKIHGERAKAWDIRVSERLACAIDASLLEAIREVFAKRKSIRLVSVQPYLMAFYNQSRKRIPHEGAWLALAESGRTCLARLTQKGWASVHNGRETDIDVLLERERSRASGEPLPSLVLKA